MVYIVAMNGGTLVQAVIVKLVSATWVMVLLSMATPLTVLTFAVPWLVGEEHAEPLTSTTFISAGLITFGTLVYRLGSIPPTKSEKQPSPIPSPSTPKPTRDVGVQTALTLSPHR